MLPNDLSLFIDLKNREKLGRGVRCESSLLDRDSRREMLRNQSYAESILRDECVRDVRVQIWATMMPRASHECDGKSGGRACRVAS